MRNGRISTSGLKSDVTVVFVDHDFLYDAGISEIRPQISVILRIFHCMRETAVFPLPV